MGHRWAKLTPFGGRLLVERIIEKGWPVATAAESIGVSRPTAHEWMKRFREEGYRGLEDRSRRPRICLHALPAPAVQEILTARLSRKVGLPSAAGRSVTMRVEPDSCTPTF